ncbi:Angiotensin-converting enzyme [Amphibalanus amphitrite]|uniref:Angiotensin-converting enzyme n=1 Tax=Amphibalanus amphitrite TaxID=1232801 RepID=A0A6A4VCF0_AMPAM|nr:Angiotensin-converting enzyme [Amphibalanus amphitrite]
MRAAALACCLLASLAAVALGAAVPAWSDSVQHEYDQLVAEAGRERWQRQHGAQPGEAELRLATLSAALLTRLKEQPHNWETVQRRLQLQRNAATMNLGKVELDGMLSVDGELRQQKVYDALREYLTAQGAMATALGMESASQLWWAPFTTGSGEARSELQTLWSRTAPLVSGLLEHLRSLPAPAGGSVTDLVYACAARDDCAELVKLALPYPDVANVVSDLLREKELSTEQLARLSEQFLGLLGLPAAPARFWANSEFRAAAADCSSYVDADRMRLCADTNAQGLRSALSLMTSAEYLRTAAAGQPAPFHTAPFPGRWRPRERSAPSVVQQLLYGYRSDEASSKARLAVVSLYLARGGRSAGQADARCHGDIGCQQAANAVMEAAVTQLLPISYHAASLRWLEALEAAPATDADATWRTEMSSALGAPAAAATPSQLDKHFYDAGRHIARVLAGVAGFQLHAAACPEGTAQCLPDGAEAAGALISRVMAAGSSLPWDRLLQETTGRAPSAEPLISLLPAAAPSDGRAAAASAYTGTGGPEGGCGVEEKDFSILRIEARNDDQTPGGFAPAAPVVPVRRQAPTAATACGNVPEDQKTPEEKALCLWNDEFDVFRQNATDAEWEFGLDLNATENLDNLVKYQKAFLQRRNEARSSLGDNPDKWINDSSNADEAKLWGEAVHSVGEGSRRRQRRHVGAAAAVDRRSSEGLRGRVRVPVDKQSCDDAEKLTIWDLQTVMAAGSMEEEEAQYYWRQYRAAAKTDLHSTFSDYIARGRDAASQAGLQHYGQFWLEPYGYGSTNETLLEELADTWADLDELYRSLHTVVRHQLNQAGLSSATGKQPLPVDMFAADWRNIYNDTKPFDNYTVDITDKLEEQSYDIVKIQTDAAEYLKKLGLVDDLMNTECFGDSNWVECEKGQDCDALAWTSGVDDCIKIRVTPEITMDNYERVHAKSAELAYYLQYRSLGPRVPYRSQPRNLESKSLLPVPMAQVDGLYDIDFLYRRALQHLAPLPFNYVTNKWLWELFGNSLDRWEHRWWELREDIQGVRPSESRSADDLDMLAVPDLARDRPAFQRYMSTVLQFQLFEKACVDAGQFEIDKAEEKPLYRCSLDSSAAAGLKDLMAAGNTQRWKALLKQYTVNGTLSSISMVRYFAPLHKHLQRVIESNNLETTWESDLVDYWDEEVDNTVPIVVGVVLGVLVLIVVIAYFVSRVRRNKEE